MRVKNTPNRKVFGTIFSIFSVSAEKESLLTHATILDACLRSKKVEGFL
jgi:hypothetical protein